MKRLLIVISVLFLSLTAANAQRIGYIDTDSILAQIPEYVQAQQQLNDLADKYKSAVENDLGRVDRMYKSYQANKQNYSVSERSSMEEEIISSEQAVKEKQKLYFGEDGVMAQKTAELVGPIKKRVQNAIDSMAESGNYMLIIDLAANNGIVYSDSRYNLNGEILKLLK
ncbi:MAG: OmpH family outer membrane protein [Bacteroidales bacterium]|jgi:outer membrane protein|nr:OmpH family outer membrane protein [Bacteroidales bacterium]MCI2122203.1 OmpH family outer membrane protein [Bacteroidales bacterium]MCI2145329.1 OmpH family outer membrane protein [Bacteroidales bacterium]